MVKTDMVYLGLGLEKILAMEVKPYTEINKAEFLLHVIAKNRIVLPNS
ncbi:hypothetical protein [Vibrio sp. B1REV9]|nr:hypothetical protein [Vibrio sp. B1REV9]